MNIKKLEAYYMLNPINSRRINFKSNNDTVTNEKYDIACRLAAYYRTVLDNVLNSDSKYADKDLNLLA